MDYQQILEKLAQKEHISAEEIEKEMAEALAQTGVSSTLEEFILQVAKKIKQTIYRNIV